MGPPSPTLAHQSRLTPFSDLFVSYQSYHINRQLEEAGNDGEMSGRMWTPSLSTISFFLPLSQHVIHEAV